MTPPARVAAERKLRPIMASNLLVNETSRFELKYEGQSLTKCAAFG